MNVSGIQATMQEDGFFPRTFAFHQPVPQQFAVTARHFSRTPSGPVALEKETLHSSVDTCRPFASVPAVSADSSNEIGSCSQDFWNQTHFYGQIKSIEVEEIRLHVGQQAC
jgi:hypothetical protein